MRQEPHDSDYFDRIHFLITVFLLVCIQADAFDDTRQNNPCTVRLIRDDLRTDNIQL